MAPIPFETVDERLKDVIQDLYDILNNTAGYQGPATQQELVRNVTRLAGSLSELSKTSSAIPVEVPPEIIEYVDEKRNPDIYTREFVELVQQGNQELKSKSEAFASFRDILAEELVASMPEFKGDVSRILAGGPVEEVKIQNSQMQGS